MEQVKLWLIEPIEKRDIKFSSILFGNTYMHHSASIS